MVEKFNPTQQPLHDAMSAFQSADERVWFENKLLECRQKLRDLPRQASNFQRAQLELEIAEALTGLNRLEEAWSCARPLVELFIAEQEFEHAVKACRVLYQANQKDSIVALGQGCWLAVTYPVDPGLTIEMLHNIVDETPEQSDGAAVAAMAAHYIADVRAKEQHENLTFLTMQILAKVAKRHRGIEDEESIRMWIEILELNDTDKLFNRLATIVDVMTGDAWWFDRDHLRAQLPVN